jgi:hypothetical protein
MNEAVIGRPEGRVSCRNTLLSSGGLSSARQPSLSTSQEYRKADSSRHKYYGDPEQREEAAALGAVLKSRL